MKTRKLSNVLGAIVAQLCAQSVGAVTNTFFNAAQTMTIVSSNQTTITINSGDYQFTYSQDGYWASAPGGPPTGRFFYVLWPAGVQAQSYTAGPSLGTGANITLKRIDGKPFGLQAFTGKILLNTAATGAAFEIMPLVGGEDAFANPLMYDCTGYWGASFPYTTALTGYDTYKIHMWGDFALTALTLIDTNSAPPVVTITNTIAASTSPAGAGTVGGAGNYLSNSICNLTSIANPGWSFVNWTVNGTQVSTSPNYSFTVNANRGLVAVFVPVAPELHLTLTASGVVRLTWPTNGAGFTLQRNADVATTNWMGVTNLPVAVGTNFQADLGFQDQAGFFRLKYP